MEDVVTKAYNDFMTRAFGMEVDLIHPGDYSIHEDEYKEHMAAIQEIYGLSQGHPQYLEFMLTMVGRSPKIIKGAGTDDGTTEA